MIPQHDESDDLRRAPLRLDPINGAGVGENDLVARHRQPHQRGSGHEVNQIASQRRVSEDPFLSPTRSGDEQISIGKEGHSMRRFEELALVRRRTPLFALSWTVMHPIGESSPLHGANRESMLEDQVEIVVILSGTDETYSDKVYARHSYVPHDIHWRKKFADILSTHPSGRRVLDLRKFHAVEDLDV